MLIANPIYDVVFKYMMEDLAVAKLFIGTIISHKVLDIKPQPQEKVMSLRDGGLTVYRLDFVAEIETQEGDCLYMFTDISTTLATAPPSAAPTAPATCPSTTPFTSTRSRRRRSSRIRSRLPSQRKYRRKQGGHCVRSG